MEEYRVNLDIYNGPLDLLLYLIRRDEVDIYDIPVSSLTEQYVKYVEVLHQLDPNMAGEFLVMAATLLEIKTRMLLPTPPPEEGQEQGLSLDPRTELVRQLLEYKAFKDAAFDLREAGEQQSQRFPRRPILPEVNGAELDLEDVQVWDLVDAFSRLMESIGKGLVQHEVIYDDTPVELHAEDIMDRLSREGSLTFRRIFEGRTRRSEIVGLFLALLELVRLRKIVAAQELNFGEIYVRPNPNPDPDGGAQASGPEAEAGEAAPAPAMEQAGQYVSDRTDDRSMEQDDEQHPAEDSGTGV